MLKRLAFLLLAALVLAPPHPALGQEPTLDNGFPVILELGQVVRYYYYADGAMRRGDVTLSGCNDQHLALWLRVEIEPRLWTRQPLIMADGGVLDETPGVPRLAWAGACQLEAFSLEKRAASILFFPAVGAAPAR